ncbi:MAG TPA: NfeD family protein [Pirellula sp.]|nr:NfeD family protein [Pirellula sp.]
MSLLVIAVLLFIASLVIFAIDLMIPSGGVLVGVTASFALAAVLVAFRHSTNTGVWMLIATLGSAPVMMWGFLEIWPRTPFGRRMTSPPEPAGEFVWSDAAKSKNVNSLIGAEGVAMGEMIPSGLVQIGEQSYEAFSESGPIDAGKPVRVIRLDVGRLVVTTIRVNKPSDFPMSHGTGLDRPASELDIDSFDG